MRTKNERDEVANMLKQLKSWFGKSKTQSRRPHPAVKLTLEVLEDRLCAAGDTYTWNPGAVNVLANNAANWEKNGVQQAATGTLPGNNANDTVILDGRFYRRFWPQQRL
jgi:hypothetical protein